MFSDFTMKFAMKIHSRKIIIANTQPNSIYAHETSTIAKEDLKLSLNNIILEQKQKQKN